MRLNSEAQHALLFVLYLGSRARSNIHDAADGLGLSVSFLEQIARKLRIAGIVKSVRGPGGGYEITNDVSIGGVLTAIGCEPLLTAEETRAYATGCPEKRQLAEIIGMISYDLSNSLKASTIASGKLLTMKEETLLDSAASSATVN